MFLLCSGVCASPTNRAAGHRGFCARQSGKPRLLLISFRRWSRGSGNAQSRRRRKFSSQADPAGPVSTLQSCTVLWPCGRSHRLNACLLVEGFALQALQALQAFRVPSAALCSGDGRRRLSSLFARLACVRHGGRRTWTNNGICHAFSRPASEVHA